MKTRVQNQQTQHTPAFPPSPSPPTMICADQQVQRKMECACRQRPEHKEIKNKQSVAGDFSSNKLQYKH